MVYFISGHRNISYKEFEKYYIPKIDKVALEDTLASFVIGDYEGVDKMAMDYIANTYPFNDLTIYHMFDSPRNKPDISDTDICLITYKGGFQTDEERDSAMTHDSDFDIAFIKDNRWNSGTAQNIKRRSNII